MGPEITSTPSGGLPPVVVPGAPAETPDLGTSEVGGGAGTVRTRITTLYQQLGGVRQNEGEAKAQVAKAAQEGQEENSNYNTEINKASQQTIEANNQTATANTEFNLRNIANKAADDAEAKRDIYPRGSLSWQKYDAIAKQKRAEAKQHNENGEKALAKAKEALQKAKDARTKAQESLKKSQLHHRDKEKIQAKINNLNNNINQIEQQIKQLEQQEANLKQKEQEGKKDAGSGAGGGGGPNGVGGSQGQGGQRQVSFNEMPELANSLVDMARKNPIAASAFKEGIQELLDQAKASGAPRDIIKQLEKALKEVEQIEKSGGNDSQNQIEPTRERESPLTDSNLNPRLKNDLTEWRKITQLNQNQAIPR